jgi:Uma2 family endonuclease
MEALIQTPPRTLMEVYKMLPEGTCAELIENVLYMPPSPTTEHQRQSLKLVSSLSAFLEQNGLGEVFCSPLDVYLDETSNAVQSDIIVVLKDQMDIIDNKGHIHGVPAILIEILSKGNREHDLIRKKDLYERFGVQEYHVVDTETKLVLSFSLAEGMYTTAKEEIGSLYSPLLQATFTF